MNRLGQFPASFFGKPLCLIAALLVAATLLLFSMQAMASEDKMQSVMDEYGHYNVARVIQNLDSGWITVVEFGPIPKYPQKFRPDLRYTNRITLYKDFQRLGLSFPQLKGLLDEQKSGIQVRREEEAQKREQSMRLSSLSVPEPPARYRPPAPKSTNARAGTKDVLRESAVKPTSNVTTRAAGIVLPRMLFSFLIGFIIYYVVTKNRNPFIKPEDSGARPRWFLGVGLGLGFALAFSSPVTGELGKDLSGRLFIRTVFFVLYSVIIVIGYFIYRWKVKSNSRSDTDSAEYSKVRIDAERSGERDEKLYKVAELEWEVYRSEELWIKALTLAEGDQELAKFKYISLRVEQLKAS